MAISVFDLFKIGIGPSSSHTVGPMRAAALFVAALRERELLERVRRIEVRLYGSLSATGVGHGSDRAVIMGLMGEWPDSIDPAQIAPRMATLLECGELLLDGRLPIAFDWVRDMRLLDENLPYHPNAMTLIAEGEDGELHSDTYYSVGGGFVVDAAQAAGGLLDQDHTALPYDFSSGAELLRLCRQHGLRVSQLMLANEKAWRSEAEIRAGLLKLWQAMQDCVTNGLREEGILPGGLSVRRRAAKLHRSLQELGKPNVIGSTMSAMEWVNLYALAVNEENAAGGRMVTAPTNGAAGIIRRCCITTCASTPMPTMPMWSIFCWRPRRSAFCARRMHRFPAPKWVARGRSDRLAPWLQLGLPRCSAPRPNNLRMLPRSAWNTISD